MFSCYGIDLARGPWQKTCFSEVPGNTSTTLVSKDRNSLVCVDLQAQKLYTAIVRVSLIVGIIAPWQVLEIRRSPKYNDDSIQKTTRRMGIPKTTIMKEPPHRQLVRKMRTRTMQ